MAKPNPTDMTHDQIETERQTILDRLWRRKRRTIERVMEDGRDYLRLQALLAVPGHGNFQAEIDGNAPDSKRTVYRYIDVAQVLGDVDCATLAQMDLTATYDLASAVKAYAKEQNIEVSEAREVYTPYLKAMERLSIQGGGRWRKVSPGHIKEWIEDFEKRLQAEEEALNRLEQGLFEEEPDDDRRGGDDDQTEVDADEHGGGDEAEHEGDGSDNGNDAGDSANLGTDENTSDPTTTGSGESVDDGPLDANDAGNQEFLSLAADITEAVEELKGDGIFIESGDGHLKFGPDIYYTPPEAVDILVPFLPRGTVIWECASGDGHIANRLRGYDFSVVESDIRRGTNFLSCDPPDCDIVITNPPGRGITDFVIRCYALGRPFALLMPITALESAPRQEQYRNGLELLIPDRRIRFVDPYGKVGNSPPCLSAWFCWGLLPAPYIFAPLLSPGP